MVISHDITLWRIYTNYNNIVISRNKYKQVNKQMMIGTFISTRASCTKCFSALHPQTAVSSGVIERFNSGGEHFRMTVPAIENTPAWQPKVFGSIVD